MLNSLKTSHQKDNMATLRESLTNELAKAREYVASLENKLAAGESHFGAILSAEVDEVKEFFANIKQHLETL